VPPVTTPSSLGAPRHSAGDSGNRGPRIGKAIGIWVAEVGIGLIPLLADNIVHHFMKSQGYLVRCGSETGAGTFAGCFRVSDSVDAEKCILTIVLSGLAILASLVWWRSIESTVRTLFRILTLVSLFALVVMGAVLYALIVGGINQNTHGAVNWILAGAVVGSALLAVEREF